MVQSENQRVKKIRLAHHLNQVEFAKSLNIEQGSLSDIERGKAGVSQNILSRLETVYKVNPLWIINGTQPTFLDGSTMAHITSINIEKIDSGSINDIKKQPAPDYEGKMLQLEAKIKFLEMTLQERNNFIKTLITPSEVANKGVKIKK